MENIYVISEDKLLEHNSLFLADSEQTIEIRYDPKVSSFKYVVSESLTQTLGRAYPFVRRNGDTYYRKFNITGLISARVEQSSSTIMDSVTTGDSDTHTETGNQTFASFEDEIKTEKQYRDALISFLYNGKAKVFSSFTEGEMIVRLMNVSLSPKQELGRMIYSFSAEVVEIADFTADNISKYCGITASTVSG